jgi:hypothetical protein
MSDRTERLVAHYATVWRGSPRVVAPSGGRSAELPADFRVTIVPPTDATFAWAYATAGMSQPSDDEGVELHLLSRGPDDVHVDLLAAVAHYHRTGARLGLGHTVNFGRPWAPGSACEYGLISLPYPFGPALEHFADATLAARCLWLIPITRAERDFKAANGAEALESRFEERQFDYLNPARASVA